MFSVFLYSVPPGTTATDGLVSHTELGHAQTRGSRRLHCVELSSPTSLARPATTQSQRSPEPPRRAPRRRWRPPTSPLPRALLYPAPFITVESSSLWGGGEQTRDDRELTSQREQRGESFASHSSRSQDRAPCRAAPPAHPRRLCVQLWSAVLRASEHFLHV